MNKKLHYTYITTNLLNGKQYVGDHSTINLNDKLSIEHKEKISYSLLKNKK